MSLPRKVYKFFWNDKMIKIKFVNYNYMVLYISGSINLNKMKIQKLSALLRTSLLIVQLIIIALNICLIVVVINKRKCKVQYLFTYFHKYHINVYHLILLCCFLKFFKILFFKIILIFILNYI